MMMDPLIMYGKTMENLLITMDNLWIVEEPIWVNNDG